MEKNKIEFIEFLTLKRCNLIKELQPLYERYEQREAACMNVYGVATLKEKNNLRELERITNLLSVIEASFDLDEVKSLLESSLSADNKYTVEYQLDLINQFLDLKSRDEIPYYEANKLPDFFSVRNVEQINYSFDQEGNLEFNTQINSGDAFINSTGVVYNDNVVIKQSEIKDGISSYQLISWSVKNNNYDYIVFDNSVSLDNCYQKIKSLKVDLSNEDIYNKFLELEISFDNVALVLLKQKVDSLSVMLNDKESSISNKSFFNL